MINIQALLSQQQHYFSAGHCQPISYRIQALQQLKQAIQRLEPDIMQALKKDLNKSDLEAFSTEIGIALKEINISIRKVKQWSKRKRVKTPLTHVGTTSYQYAQPYGVVLIIAPWNYPFQLAISPLIGAIAAGNCVVIKPSELAPHTSSILHKLISSIYEQQYVAVVEGGVEVNQALLAQQWDYIFFTGSVRVGKLVMEAAAKHVTPITLELGGKSPCIVHRDANIQLAAKRIAWGKFINAGQTCIAPDYMYIHHEVKDQFIAAFSEAVKELYGEQLLQNEHITRMVSPNHFQRLKKFLDDGNIVVGGQFDEEKRIMEPTLMEGVSWSSPVMQEEIFGPILPLLTYEDLADVVKGVEEHRNPLAFYLFTENRGIQEQLINRISFGGGCINDTIFHFANPHLPFGGIGTSGIGSYHGKKTFDTFTHFKSVLKQTTTFDLPFRYPNMKHAMNVFRFFLK